MIQRNARTKCRVCWHWIGESTARMIIDIGNINIHVCADCAKREYNQMLDWIDNDVIESKKILGLPMAERGIIQPTHDENGNPILYGDFYPPGWDGLE